MAIKESSDELNPPVVSGGSNILKPKRARSAKDYLALAIATCGVGYLPLAPGTWGSLLAVASYLFLHNMWFPHTDLPSAAFVRSYLLVQLLTIAIVIIIGIWSASRTERALKIKDPGKVVIDEVAGQLIALLPVASGLWRAADAVTVVAAFILFRFFDIVKPYPARKFEALKGGWGIMADDLVAGVYAALGVALIRWIV